MEIGYKFGSKDYFESLPELFFRQKIMNTKGLLKDILELDMDTITMCVSVCVCA